VGSPGEGCGTAIGCVVGVVALTVIGIATYRAPASDRGGTDEEPDARKNTARVRIPRLKRHTGAVWDIAVYVNDTELRAVGNGETRCFLFTPDPKGNTLRLIARQGRLKEAEMEFEVAPGKRSTCRATSGWGSSQRGSCWSREGR
jgi:hypothetical protein